MPPIAKCNYQKCFLALACVIAGLLARPMFAQGGAEAAGKTHKAGRLANGTAYLLDRPENWNGVLVIDPDLTIGRADAVGKALRSMGYATATRSRDVTTWRVREGSTDLVELKSLFSDLFARPRRTILIGGSLGGLVTRDAAEVYPQAFDGTVPTCGGGAGTIGMYNMRFDIGFALKTLLAPENKTIQLSEITDGVASSAALKQVVEAALGNPQGRARLALAGAIGQIEGWPARAAEPPPQDDIDARLNAIAASESGELVLREEVEKAAGGTFSWNVGVDYKAIFKAAAPSSIAMTKELYRRAGLNLEADLDRLNAAPRFQADASAVAWARNNGTPTGKLKIPTLVLFTAVDPRASRSEFRAYQQIVDRAGAQAMLHQLGAYHSGHCSFTGSELLAAITAMDERIKTGRWPDVTVDGMNARARALNLAQGGGLGDPRFADFADTPQFTRTFGADDPLPAGALRPVNSTSAATPKSAE